MKITILGSGSAYGSPMCFNSWGKEQDIHNSKNLRTRPSILISDAGKNILVDMGPDFREQINKNNIRDIDAVFITHGHYDHIACIPELWRVSTVLNKQIPVYCSEETMEELRRVYYYMFRNNNESGSQSIIWNTIEHNQKFNACGLDFNAFGVLHHKLHTTCFRLNNFAYIPDLQELPELAKKQLSNLDLLIIECNNGFEKSENGHSDIEQVLTYIKELSPKKTILTHLSVKVDYDKLTKVLPSNIELAFDGMEAEI